MVSKPGLGTGFFLVREPQGDKDGIRVGFRYTKAFRS
jgi:hypothetical protein